MKSSMRMLLISVFAGLLGGCIVSDRTLKGGSTLGGDDVAVLLQLHTPGGFPGSRSRALSYAGENAIDNIHVLVFSPGGALLAVKQGEDVKDNTSGAGAQVTPQDGYSGSGSFSVTLTASRNNEKHTLVVLANVAQELIHQVELMEGQSHSAVMEALAVTISGPMFDPRGEEGGEGGVPMWGQAEPMEISSSNNPSVSVELTRAVARIDVGIGHPQRNDATDSWIWNGRETDQPDGAIIPFELTEVYVMSPSNRYAIIPDQAKLQAEKPTLPAGMDSFTAQESEELFGFTSVAGVSADQDSGVRRGGYITRQIYVPEADVHLTTDGAQGDKNHNLRMAIVVGGHYENSPAKSYYRIDFATPGSTGRYELVDVLRNHAYQFNITKVAGSGQPTIQQAYEAEAINVTVKVIDWDIETNEVIVSGSSFFSTSGRNVSFPATGGEHTMTLKTNIEVPFTMTLPAGNTDTGEDVVLVSPMTTGQSVSWPESGQTGGGVNFTYTLTMTSEAEEGARSYTLHIVAAPNFGAGAVTRTDIWQLEANGNNKIKTDITLTQAPREFHTTITDQSIINISAEAHSPLVEILSSEPLTPVVSWPPGVDRNEDWLTASPLDPADQTVNPATGLYSISLSAMELNFGDLRDGADGIVARRAAVTLTRAGGETISVVVVQAIPEIEYYPIEVNPAQPVESAGTAVASPTLAYEGERVSLLAKPAAGYAFSRWVVEKGGFEIENPAAGMTTFTMPGKAVEITPVFVAIASGPSYIEPDDPGAALLLYIDSENRLQAGNHPSQVAAKDAIFTKFGSVVGFTYTGYGETYSYDGKADTWGEGDIKFNPSSTATDELEDGAAGYQAIGVYSSADWDEGLTNVSNPAYHNLANVLAGRGDICRLVGYTADQIKNMSTLPATSKYRLPTVAEQSADFVSMASWTAMTTDIPRTPGLMTFNNGLVLPALSMRDTDGEGWNDWGLVGYCWTSTPDHPWGYTIRFFDGDVNPAYSRRTMSGITVRCVEDVIPLTLAVDPTTLSWTSSDTAAKLVRVESNAAWQVSLASGAGFSLSQTAEANPETSISGSGNGWFFITPAAVNTARTPVTAAYTVAVTEASGKTTVPDPIYVTATQGALDEFETTFPTNLEDWIEAERPVEL